MRKKRQRQASLPRYLKFQKVKLVWDKINQYSVSRGLKRLLFNFRQSVLFRKTLKVPQPLSLLNNCRLKNTVHHHIISRSNKPNIFFSWKSFMNFSHRTLREILCLSVLLFKKEFFRVSFKICWKIIKEFSLSLNWFFFKSYVKYSNKGLTGFFTIFLSHNAFLQTKVRSLPS